MGILYNSMIELGRMDKSLKVSVLSPKMVLTYQGHLQAAQHTILYLSLHQNSRLCMDMTYPGIDSTQFHVCNWSGFYGDVEADPV